MSWLCFSRRVAVVTSREHYSAAKAAIAEVRRHLAAARLAVESGDLSVGDEELDAVAVDLDLAHNEQLSLFDLAWRAGVSR